MSRLATLLAPFVLAAMILTAWETACRLLQIPIYFLPPPSAVFASLIGDGPSLFRAAADTFAEALEAFVIASVLAQALALIVALSMLLERAVKPLAVILQVTPVVGIAPLVNIWAGTDHPQRAVVGLATLVAFFPIYSGAVTGLKSADADLMRLFDLYGASRVQRLLRLRLPSAIPYVLEGHKVAAGLSLVGAVVAEFVSGSGKIQGLAWQILEAGNRLQTARMFAALVVLGLLGAILHAVLEAAEKAGLRWWRGR